MLSHYGIASRAAHRAQAYRLVQQGPAGSAEFRAAFNRIDEPAAAIAAIDAFYRPLVETAGRLMSATAPALVFPPPAGLAGRHRWQSAAAIPAAAGAGPGSARTGSASSMRPRPSSWAWRRWGACCSDFFPADCPLFTLLDQARAEGASVADREMTVETPALGHRLIAVDVAPLADRAGLAVADPAGALLHRPAGRGADPPRRHPRHGDARGRSGP